MALGSLSSAKINKKILFFQGKALFYLFIISNIFVHHVTIHGMNAFFREMDAYHTPTSFRQIIEQIGVGLKLYRLAVLINQLIGIQIYCSYSTAQIWQSFSILEIIL